jgi:prepilin-type N-terminal cleavage/methylation domain-containing protein
MSMQAGTKGFTLLEVLVALAIMAVAVTMVIQLFSANLRTVAASVNMTSAVARADARIRGIISDESLTEKVWSETTEEGYRFDVSISEILKDRTDNLPVKLMEVVLTTRWISGMKEKSFNLKTVKMVDKESTAEKLPI